MTLSHEFLKMNKQKNETKINFIFILIRSIKVKKNAKYIDNIETINYSYVLLLNNRRYLCLENKLALKFLKAVKIKIVTKFSCKVQDFTSGSKTTTMFLDTHHLTKTLQYLYKGKGRDQHNI